MTKELKERRKFRPNFHDLEVVIEDDFGIARPSYIGLGNSPDIDLEILNLITESQRRTDKVKEALAGAGIHFDSV